LNSGRFAHSENWRGPRGTPVQFFDDQAFAKAIASLEFHTLDSHRLRIVNRKELVYAKLRAAFDPARRKSKRMQDLADVQGLIEQHPELENLLTADQRAVLGS
jgi:hypothetical protein